MYTHFHNFPSISTPYLKRRGDQFHWNKQKQNLLLTEVKAILACKWKHLPLAHPLYEQKMLPPPMSDIPATLQLAC